MCASPGQYVDLGFVRRSMVRWFDPHQLIDTAVRVLLSGVFSSYADDRELQAREPAGQLDRSGQNSLVRPGIQRPQSPQPTRSRSPGCGSFAARYAGVPLNGP